jgi:hypothetical protein
MHQVRKRAKTLTVDKQDRTSPLAGQSLKKIVSIVSTQRLSHALCSDETDSADLSTT